MKTPSAQSLRRLKFKIRFFGDYAEQIGQLKKIPALKPEKLRALERFNKSYSHRRQTTLGRLGRLPWPGPGRWR